jgi:hypothetical protein
MTDFWWLTPKWAVKQFYVDLVHHSPLNEDDDAPYQAFSNPDLVWIGNMHEWCDNHKNTNIYRSLKIWQDNLKSEAISGPYVIDIDNINEDLDDALVVTRNITRYLIESYNLIEGDYRLLFTGHKGFSIEVLPNALGLVGVTVEEDPKANNVRKDIIDQLRSKSELSPCRYQSVNLVSEQGTIIDPIKYHVRLHQSINKWIQVGKPRARRKIGLTLSELDSLSLYQILARASV